MTMYPPNLSPGDWAEYVDLVGLGSAAGKAVEEPVQVVCQSPDATTGAVCSLELDHDAHHRDTSDDGVVMSWLDTPEFVLLGVPVE